MAINAEAAGLKYYSWAKIIKKSQICFSNETSLIAFVAFLR
jgi:hypothetical protein